MSDKPRICDVLGVEVGEEFTFPYPNRTYDRVFVKENGQIWERVDRTGNTHKLGGAAVCWLINHTDSIRKYHMLTEKETEMCRAIGAKWVSRGTAADIDVCFVKLWTEKPELCKSQYFHMGGYVGKIVVDLFPSVCPGACLEVPYD